MTDIINGYIQSCVLVKKRIAELSTLMKQLRNNGNEEEIERLDLERRISLLYTEHRDMQEIIGHLRSKYKRINCRAKTTGNLL